MFTVMERLSGDLNTKVRFRARKVEDPLLGFSGRRSASLKRKRRWSHVREARGIEIDGIARRENDERIVAGI